MTLVQIWLLLCVFLALGSTFMCHGTTSPNVTPLNMLHVHTRKRSPRGSVFILVLNLHENISPVLFWIVTNVETITLTLIHTAPGGRHLEDHVMRIFLDPNKQN